MDKWKVLEDIIIQMDGYRKVNMPMAYWMGMEEWFIPVMNIIKDLGKTIYIMDLENW
jgi:hypothetical protein